MVDYAGTDSVCDGLDNDCDGLVDEDLGESPVAENQLGVCAGSRRSVVGRLRTIRMGKSGLYYATHSVDYQ